MKSNGIIQIACQIRNAAHAYYSVTKTPVTPRSIASSSA
jgi:hypothetical protein